ncbi:MAG TPA: hypothetical protein PL037_00100 [Elusimicrobiales bacterium]|nr:hypothetical protein [Elusimicrobiales bacterium]
MELFPPPDKSGSIKFLMAKSLPYPRRIALVAGLMAAGLGVQLAASFWAGLALLAAASLLGMAEGYDARPKTAGEAKWERVTPDEYALIRRKADRLRRWDEDLFDFSNPRGAGAFFGACVLLAALFAFLAARFALPSGFRIFAGLDAMAVLFPLWFSGTREYLRKDGLVIKTELLERVMKRLAAPSEVQVFPMLSLAGTEGGSSAPEDAKLLVKLVGASADFYGIQVQVAINSVRGKDFPYLYCVLAARSGSGLLSGWEEISAKAGPSPASSRFLSRFSSLLGLSGPGLLFERQDNKEADVLVIRQSAGKNSGYFTPEPAAVRIVETAVETAKKLAAAAAARAVRPSGPSARGASIVL